MVPRIALAFFPLFLPTAQGYAQTVLGVPVGGDAGAAVAVVEPVETEREEARAALHIEVSLEERRLYVFEGEEEIGSFAVAVGQQEHPTPRGEFSIRRVIWNPRWVPPKAGWARGKTAKAPGDPDNPMGRVKMFFQEPDYYIHGTNAQESLGTAASHGCIRMANEDIVELAKLVMEHGGEPREPGWFRRVLNRVRNTSEVRLGNPVPVVIRG